MYSNTQALPRPDINTFVIEAANVENLLVAPRIFGVYSSPTREGAYPKITTQLGELLKAPDGNTPDDFTLRGKDGSYNEINRAHTSDSFVCVDRGLEERIDDAFSRDASRFFDVEVITAQMILRQMRLAQEVRAAAVLFNSNTFNATNSVTPYTEANIATMDFAQDVTNAVDRLTGKGVTPNTMVLSQPVWNRLRRSARLQTYLYGNLPSGLQRMVSDTDLATAFGIQNVIIAAVRRDTSAKKASSVLSHIWGTNFVWIGNTASGDFAAGGAVRQIIWTGDAPDLFVTETYRNEARRGDMVRVRQFATEKVIDQTAGELITTQWA
jgi:hypothetical protein